MQVLGIPLHAANGCELKNNSGNKTRYKESPGAFPEDKLHHITHY